MQRSRHERTLFIARTSSRQKRYLKNYYPDYLLTKAKATERELVVKHQYYLTEKCIAINLLYYYVHIST